MALSGCSFLIKLLFHTKVILQNKYLICQRLCFVTFLDTFSTPKMDHKPYNLENYSFLALVMPNGQKASE